MDPDKAPQRAMSLQDAEYPDWEHGQQQNSQQAARKGAMTMKALSRKLTDEYPAITKLIPGRPLAEKWETTMAAIAQIIAVFKPGEIGNPNTLVFPAVHNQPDGRKLEETQIAAFDSDTSKFLIPEIIEDLEHVWHIWIETITYASAIGAHVYEKSFYGPPRSIPWIEFIGIAVVITKHYQIYGHDDNADIYATKLILADVSRLRRWLRCKLNSDGFRRSDGDWTVCWDIINERPGAEKTIPAVSGFTVARKGSTRFYFRDEPELDLVVEQDPESDEEDEAMEVGELTATVEAEVEEDDDDDDDDAALEVDQMMVTVGDDSGEELHPKLRGTVTGPVHVEPEDLVGGAVGTERAEYGRVARNDAAKYYPVDNTREFF